MILALASGQQHLEDRKREEQKRNTNEAMTAHSWLRILLRIPCRSTPALPSRSSNEFPGLLQDGLRVDTHMWLSYSLQVLLSFILSGNRGHVTLPGTRGNPRDAKVADEISRGPVTCAGTLSLECHAFASVFHLSKPLKAKVQTRRWTAGWC